MTPFVQDADFTLYVGDVREGLAGLPTESVHCVVTSPPYWGLRDYGTGSWAGGDPDCDHKQRANHDHAGDIGPRNAEGNAFRNSSRYVNQGAEARDVCGKCGATRTDQQLGLEPTPELYVENMVGVFREVRRVLRRDGTCWLNIGDTYRSPRYFYDADAVREPAEWARWGDQTYSPAGEAMYGQRIKPRPKADLTPRNDGDRWNEANGRGFVPNQSGRNLRSVWEIATQPYPEAHFATYPEALVERCVKAGSPLGGTILDPFMGSGTTALVARNLGRRSIGIELNETYASLAARRLSQQSLLTEAS